MSILAKVEAFTAGKKTYATALGFIGFALYAYFVLGDANAAIKALLEGFGLGALRSGVAKS